MLYIILESLELLAFGIYVTRTIGTYAVYGAYRAGQYSLPYLKSGLAHVGLLEEREEPQTGFPEDDEYVHVSTKDELELIRAMEKHQMNLDIIREHSNCRRNNRQIEEKSASSEEVSEEGPPDYEALAREIDD